MSHPAATTAPAGKHPVDEVLPLPQMLIYGLQHVLSMYAGVVAVPLIIGSAAGLSARDLTYLVCAALFLAGLATLLQTLGVWKIGARQPIVQGTSFVAVATMLAIVADNPGTAGLQVIAGATIPRGSSRSCWRRSSPSRCGSSQRSSPAR